ncbi:hypothetical protein Tco_1554677 [Tanacetum coccineum]
MLSSEVKLDFKKWETILSENVTCPHHPSYAILDINHLVDHVMIPLTKGKARKIMVDGKRPRPQTPLESSSSPSPTQNQEENNPVHNYTLDPIVYINQLPPIEGGESPEFM